MKRLLIALGALCALALSVTAIALIVHAQRQQAAARRLIAAGPAALAREEAAARREGIPLTAGELQSPLPPPSQNAAPLYTRLTALLHDKPLGLPKYAEGMDAFHSYTPAQIAAVRRTLAARRDVMTLVHQAADKPQCVFARDWGKGMALDFPEYLPMREAARLVKTESYLLARDGHLQEAVADQALGFRVADHAASDHVLLAYLVGAACESLALNGMQSIITIAGPNAGVDASVRRAVADMPALPSLRLAMTGETGFDCFAYGQMHHAEKYGVREVISVGGLSPDKAPPRTLVPPAERAHVHDMIDAWQADFLSRMRQAVRSCDGPVASRREVFAALGNSPDLPDPYESSRLASYVLLPVFSKIDLNDTRTRARVAVTQAAAAALALKAQTGAYPDTLKAEFTDPFTDKPLLYRREGARGFVVYSAGPTGTFDGGRPGEKPPAQESVFRYPAAAMPPDVLK